MFFFFFFCKTRHVIGCTEKRRDFRLYWLSCTVAYPSCVISVVRWCCYGKMWSAVPRRLFLITSFGNAVKKKKRAFWKTDFLWCGGTVSAALLGKDLDKDVGVCVDNTGYPPVLARGELLNGPWVSGPSFALKSRYNTRWLAIKLHEYLIRRVRLECSSFSFQKQHCLLTVY